MVVAEPRDEPDVPVLTKCPFDIDGEQYGDRVGDGGEHVRQLTSGHTARSYGPPAAGGGALVEWLHFGHTGFTLYTAPARGGRTEREAPR